MQRQMLRNEVEAQSGQISRMRNLQMARPRDRRATMAIIRTACDTIQIKPPTQRAGDFVISGKFDAACTYGSAWVRAVAQTTNARCMYAWPSSRRFQVNSPLSSVMYERGVSCLGSETEPGFIYVKPA